MNARLLFAAISIAAFSIPSFAQVGAVEDGSTPETSKAPEASAAEGIPDQKPCRWWQRHCHPRIEGFPESAPSKGVVITVDTTHNIAYLWRDGKLLAKGPAATGSDKMLQRGLTLWLFRTPRGRHKIVRKVVDPV